MPSPSGAPIASADGDLADSVANPCAEPVRLWLTANSSLCNQPLAVAYSGGADSTALLLAVQRVHTGPLMALHINHGLQAAAEEFEQHAVNCCAQWGVPLHVARVSIPHRPRHSPEAQAREARYAALVELSAAHGCMHVLLAHHADDQMENLVMAWLRGSGLRGLAGMSPHHNRGGVAFHRPLLSVPSRGIRTWLQRNHWPFVDDPSNADERYTRNAVRQRVMPALEHVAPAFRHTFARSARHVAQAQRLLDGLAEQDLVRTGVPPRIAALQALGADRLANLLRHWLWLSHGVSPSTAQLDELSSQIMGCVTRGHRMSLKVGTGQVVRDGAAIRYLP